MKHLAIFLAALILAATLIVPPTAHSFGLFGKHTAVEPENGIVRIQTKDVSDGQAHYYKYAHGGREIKFFLLKSNDDVIRAAFDACDVCFHSRKGYVQDGEFMVCENCGRRFHSGRINIVKGGCNPAPLERAYDQQFVTIQVKDIMTGTKYF
jgi:uncharacterized membrane protein